MRNEEKTVLSVLKRGEWYIKHHLSPDFKSTQYTKQKFVSASDQLCRIVRDAIRMIEAMKGEEE